MRRTASSGFVSLLRLPCIVFLTAGEEAGVRDVNLQWEEPDDDYVEEGLTILMEQWVSEKAKVLP